jgi:hypothetical protein
MLKAEFSQNFLVAKLKVVTYGQLVKDISTDLLSPETKHTPDREL